MLDHRITRTTLVAVLIATTAALIARSWLQVRWVDNGMQQTLATDASYLIVPPILIALLFPLWRSEKSFLKTLFRWSALSWRVVLTAIVVGILIRLLWWTQLIAGVSFGIYQSDRVDSVVGPLISFACASPHVVVLGFLIMAVFVPIIEEITHRGYVQTALQSRGAVVSILLSAAVFAVFHEMTAWPVALFAGIVLGVQYWATQSLWPSVITHSTVNGLIQVDWQCLSIVWNPRPDDIPVWSPGIVAAIVFVTCSTCLALLLQKMTTGARAIRPGSPSS